MIFAIRNKEKAAKVPGLGSEKSPWRDPVPLGGFGGSSGMVENLPMGKNPWFCPFFWCVGGVDNKNSTDLRFLIFV